MQLTQSTTSVNIFWSSAYYLAVKAAFSKVQATPYTSTILNRSSGLLILFIYFLPGFIC